jgi:hypothetical protein
MTSSIFNNQYLDCLIYPELGIPKKMPLLWGKMAINYQPGDFGVHSIFGQTHLSSVKDLLENPN